MSRAISALRGAATDGVARYRALGDAPETRRLLLAAAGSYVGDRFNTIALVALSFELGDSALGVGGMLALMCLPNLVVQAAAGALVDRHPGKRLLIVTQVLMAAVASAFSLLTTVPSLWLLYGLVLAMAVVQTVAMPAFEVRLMALTPPDKRGTANAVHMLAMTAGEIVGPLLGGLVLVLAGATPLFLLNGLTFLVVLRVVAGLPERVRATADNVDNADATEEVDAAPASGPSGYRLMAARSDVMLYTAMTVASGVLILGAFPLFIVRANDLGLGDGGVGLFYATMGVGTLVGGVLSGMGIYRTRRALAVASLSGIVGALALVAFGAGGTLLVALPALVAFGLVADLEEIAAMTYFQHVLPEAVYGRFFSLFLMGSGAGGLVGALAGPLLAEAMGTGTALALLAVPAIAVAVVVGVREGGLRLAVPPFLPTPEPEVVGHGMFGVPSQSDLLPDRTPGGRLLTPRMSRLG